MREYEAVDRTGPWVYVRQNVLLKEASTSNCKCNKILFICTNQAWKIIFKTRGSRGGNDDG
jgi:hypothetical protein